MESKTIRACNIKGMQNINGELSHILLLGASYFAYVRNFRTHQHVKLLTNYCNCQNIEQIILYLETTPRNPSCTLRISTP